MDSSPAYYRKYWLTANSLNGACNAPPDQDHPMLSTALAQREVLYGAFIQNLSSIYPYNCRCNTLVYYHHPFMSAYSVYGALRDFSGNNWELATCLWRSDLDPRIEQTDRPQALAAYTTGMART